MRCLLLMLLIITLCGCTNRQAIQPHVLRLPKPPERIELREEGKIEKPGIRYIDPAKILNEDETFTAPKSGAAVCTPRTWRGAKYAIEEWPKWADAVQQIWGAGRPGDEDKAPWWRFWK